MTIIQTKDLTGAALDWAVATAGQEWKTAHKHFPTMTLDPTFSGISDWQSGGFVYLVPSNPMRQDPQIYNPSTDWSLGGPIIERERIELLSNGADWEAGEMGSLEGSGMGVSFCGNGYIGPTPLIAAMRCYVAAKLGTSVDVPEGLV